MQRFVLRSTNSLGFNAISSPARAVPLLIYDLRWEACKLYALCACASKALWSVTCGRALRVLGVIQSCASRAASARPDACCMNYTDDPYCPARSCEWDAISGCACASTTWSLRLDPAREGAVALGREAPDQSLDLAHVLGLDLLHRLDVPRARLSRAVTQEVTAGQLDIDGAPARIGATWHEGQVM